MKPPQIVIFLVVGFILALIWKSPSGSAQFIGDVAGAVGRFLERFANTVSTFVGGLAN